MRSAWRALGAYLLISLAATWPLALGLGRDVASDLGDPVLNMWILAWDCEQLLAILSGDVSRIESFFDANIFHPAPLTLAYSEHLIAQAVQILPIYAITENPILCYNLLFLSTFVLSGLGTFLFVRDLTGRPLAAFIAGLLFAFAPYRMPQSPHLQVLSAQWMPFALFGLHRYLASVEAGRSGLRPLAGAALALIAQGLSCGYYVLYFPPFAAAYVLWEIVRRRLWRQVRVWLQLTAAAVVVLAVTIPLLLPYAAVNEQLRFARTQSEVVRYSADVHSYATAHIEQLWGGVLRAYPKPEGDLFLGFVPLLLAAIGLIAWRRPERLPGNMELGTRPSTDARGALSNVAGRDPEPGRWRRWLPPLLAAGAALHLGAALAALVNRRIIVELWGVELRITNINQMLLRAAVFAVLLVVVSPDARVRARAFLADRGFFLCALVAALWLSLGPVPQVLGRPVEIAAPYAFLYEHVPGFEGVRVPARFAMVATLMLAVLGGFGAAALARWRRGPLLLAILAVAAVAESVLVPFPVNAVTPTRGYNSPEARVYRPGRAPAIYREFAQLAPDGVLAELPLGEPDFDLRAMFYSLVHWRPILNGYSGFYPPHYGRLALATSDVPRFPDGAIEALRALGATHVLVHEGAYLDDRGPNTTAALRQRGATELYRNGPDALLQLP